MIALDPSHENILIALIGAFGLILVALVPVLSSLRRNRTEQQETGHKVDEMQAHLPPNGERLYEMVEGTNRTVNHMRDKLDRVEGAVLTHLANHERKGEE